MTAELRNDRGDWCVMDVPSFPGAEKLPDDSDLGYPDSDSHGTTTSKDDLEAVAEEFQADINDGELDEAAELACGVSRQAVEESLDNLHSRDVSLEIMYSRVESGALLVAMRGSDVHPTMSVYDSGSGPCVSTFAA